MRVTKYGHSCLFIEEGTARILIDPGSYVFKGNDGEISFSTASRNHAEGGRGMGCDHSCAYHAAVRGTTRKLLKPEDLPQCNVLLLTHEHADHTDPEALKQIYESGIMNQESGLILTNEGVKKVLTENGIKFKIEILKPGEIRTVQGVTIRAIACDHGHIADHFPRVENVGFLIAGKLFHPGDCVTPSEEVQAEILAVPVVAPWMAVREGLEFVKKVKPKYAIPIHDAMVKWPEIPWYKIFETGLAGSGIEFVKMELGKAKEF